MTGSPDFIHVVIERPDGSTYIQQVKDDFYSLVELAEMLGPRYWIVDIF